MITFSDKEKINSTRDPFFEFVRLRKKETLFMGCGVLLGVFLGWNVVEIIIFSIFIWSILGPIPSRSLVIPALFFLIFTPIFLVLDRKDQAEEYAIYAYYFLVMAVIRAIIEIRKEKTDEESSAKVV